MQWEKGLPKGKDVLRRRSPRHPEQSNADQLMFWPHHSDPKDLDPLDAAHSILIRIIMTLINFL